MSGDYKNLCIGKGRFLKDLIEPSGDLVNIPRAYPRGENKVCVGACIQNDWTKFHLYI